MTNKRQEGVTIGFSLLRSYKQAPPVYHKTPNDLCSNAYVMMLIFSSKLRLRQTWLSAASGRCAIAYRMMPDL